MPRLTYQTSVASLAQFIALMLLGVPFTLINIISTCHSDSSNCVSNMISSLILYMLFAAWFAVIVILGVAAQKKRSRLFAFFLVGFELVTLIGCLIDFPHDSSIFDRFTVLVCAALSVWVIYIASRLFLAGNKRVVKKSSPIGRARKSR